MSRAIQIAILSSLLFFSSPVYCFDPDLVDSLKTMLRNVEDARNKVNILNGLCSEYQNTDAKQVDLLHLTGHYG